MSVTRILCPKCGAPLCYCKCEPNPDWVETERECLVADLKGSRVERGSQAIEETAEKYRNAPRYRDRIAGWPLATLQKFVVGMSKPPWWRLVARWKWRKLKRDMAKPQPGLRNWLRMATGEEIEAEYLRLRATKYPSDQETGK